MSDLAERDLLLEFIQWCGDHLAYGEEMLQDPDVAIEAVDRFLGQLSE